MKKLIFLSLLLPMFAFSQERQIGTYINGTYSFDWDMKTVVQNAMPAYQIDSVFPIDTGRLRVVFKDSAFTYSDWMKINIVGGIIYTAMPSGGCLNSCKALDCADCTKTAECGCKCLLGSICESVNLGIFEGGVSMGLRAYILNNENPD